jgi:hypothetical protein
MVNFRIEYEVPWNEIVADIEDRNNDYDGVGGNVATLCFGWIFPFVQCIGTLTFARVILIQLGRHRIKTTEQGGAGEPATRCESDSEGGAKPQPEAEGRTQ